MKTLIKILVVTSLIGALTGCKQESDPLANYPEYQDYIPVDESKRPEQQQEPTIIIAEAPNSPEIIPQKYIGTEIFQITPEREMTFIEGKTTSFKVIGRVFIPNVQFELVASDLPQGASFTKNDDGRDIGSWSFTWTPPLGFVDHDKSTKDYLFKVAIRILEVPSTEARDILEKLEKAVTLNYHVRKPEAQPTIEAVNGLPAEITQGEVAEFTVDVRDDSAYKAGLPRLDIYYKAVGNSLENYDANGTTYVRPQSDKLLPVQLQNGLWRFHYLFDTKNLEVPVIGEELSKDPENQERLKVRFTIKAVSRTMISSPEQTLRVSIRYTPSAPVISVIDKVNMKIGSSLNLTVTAFVNDQRGSVNIDENALNAALSGFPGNKSVRCASAGYMSTCQITWAVPCEKSAARKYPYKVQATNEMNGQQAVQSVNREVIVTDGTCVKESQ